MKMKLHYNFIINLSHKNWTYFLIVKILSKYMLN
jgi:hypothetical protein